MCCSFAPPLPATQGKEGIFFASRDGFLAYPVPGHVALVHLHRSWEWGCMGGMGRVGRAGRVQDAVQGARLPRCP